MISLRTSSSGTRSAPKRKRSSWYSSRRFSVATLTAHWWWISGRRRWFSRTSASPTPARRWMRGLSKGPPSARWWRRGHPRGLLVVPNGLALCALHHAAFDRNVLAVRPDLRVEVRLDVVEEEDGPMLEHGLQGFH